jgi:hypothetical protein
MNSSITKVPPVMIAKSYQEANPVALFRTMARMVSQGFDGLAFGDPLRGSAFAQYIGQNLQTVETALGRQEPKPQIQTEEVDWPLEIWTLQQLLQPFTIQGDKIVIYTSGGIVVGFGPPHSSAPR